MKIKKLAKNNQAVAVPLEFLSVFTVLIIAFVMVFSTVNNVFIPFQTNNKDLSATAMEVSEMLLKSTGNTVTGNTNWEDDPENLAYMGLGCDTLYEVYYNSPEPIVIHNEIVKDGDHDIWLESLWCDAGNYSGVLQEEHGVIEPLAIELNATAGGGTGEYTYNWEIEIDGTQYTGTEQSFTVIFTDPGTYYANLTVQDSGGNETSAIATILISEEEGIVDMWAFFMGDASMGIPPGDEWIPHYGLMIVYGGGTGGGTVYIGGDSGTGGDDSFTIEDYVDDSGITSDNQVNPYNGHSNGETPQVHNYITSSKGKNYVYKTKVRSSNTIYGMIDRDKVGAMRNGDVDYKTVKESLGLDEILDINVLITSYDGTVLLNYGESPVGRNVVSSYKRDAVMFPDVPITIKVLAFY